MALAKKQVKKLAVTKPHQVGGHYYELFKDAIGEVVSPDPIEISKVTEWLLAQEYKSTWAKLKAVTVLAECEIGFTFDGLGDFNLSLMFHGDYFELIRTINHAQSSLSEVLAKKQVSEKDANKGGFYYEHFKEAISRVISPDPKVITKVTDWVVANEHEYFMNKLMEVGGETEGYEIAIFYDRGENCYMVLRYENEYLYLIRSENSAVISFSMLMTGKDED